MVPGYEDFVDSLKTFNKLAHKKEIELYRSFEKEYLNISLDGNFIKMGDELHLLMKDC